MEQSPLILEIEQCAFGVFGLFARFFFLTCCVATGGCILWQALTAGTQLVVVFCDIFLGGVFMVIGIFVAFLYTEISKDCICSVFKVGHFLRIRFNTVKWCDVKRISTRYSIKPRTANLLIATNRGHKYVYYVSQFGEGPQIFEEVAKQIKMKINSTRQP